MAKKLTMKAPGSLLDYGARKHKLSISADPSPKGFLSRSMAAKGRIQGLFKPGGENGQVAPIAFSAKVKSLTIKLEDVVFEGADRIGDVIYLVNDDKNVGDFVFEADPEGDLFCDGGDGDSETS